MLNSIDKVSVSTTHPAFKRKGVARHELHAFIDESNRVAMELLHKDRPLEEKREALLRDTLRKFKIKDTFVGNLIDCVKATIALVKRTFNKDEYEKMIINEVKAGRMDADHARVLLGNYFMSKDIANKFLK